MNFKSYLLTDTGISLGDEGKGRLIYELYNELKSELQLVVKINGGANSGHTINGHKLNLLPSSIVIPEIPHNALGSGVVADPRKILWEIAYLEYNGFNVYNRLLIDEKCQVSDLCHRLLDIAWESYRVKVLGEPARGTTSRGISPSYSDETSQWQIFYNEFLGNQNDFNRKFTFRCKRALAILKNVSQLSPEEWYQSFETLTKAESNAHKLLLDNNILSSSELDFSQFLSDKPFELDLDLLSKTYWEAGQKIRSCITDIREIVLSTISKKKYVLGEFGQSYWLDKRQGFSPNVSASHTFTPEFFQSCGIPIQPIHNIGVMKAYDTGVGSHYFPTEFPNDCPLGNFLRTLEFGTTTGRQRSVGWLDIPTKAAVIRYGGVDDLMINKLDVLSTKELTHLKLCIAYKDPKTNEIVNFVPRNYKYRRTLLPVFIELPTWSEDISECRSFSNLPLNAQIYVSAIIYYMFKLASLNSDISNFPNIKYLGVGPNPNQIIKDSPPSIDLVKLFQTKYLHA